MKTRLSVLYPSSLAILSLTLLWLLPLMLSAVPVISFNVTDLESYTNTANWVLDYDSPGTPTHDGNAFTFSPLPAYPYHNYAHKYVHEAAFTTTPCISENIPFVADFNDITIAYSEFQLVAYEKINTVNPALPWNTPGQSGDRRTYSNATATVSLSGVPKLVLSNVTFVIDTPYPTQAQFRAQGGPFLAWLGDLGTGLAQTGYGYADINIGASDPAWVALFSTTDNKMDLELNSIVYTALPTTGLFDFVLNLKPVVIPYTTGVAVATGPINLTYPVQNLEMNFAAAVAGGEFGDEQDVFVRELLAAPSGALPIGITSVVSKYWELGTTLNSLSTSITFTINPADFAKDTADWRILQRNYNGAPWTVWADYTLLDPTHIRANNVTTLSEYTIGSNVDETLPVELSEMFAVLTSDYFVNLTWVTESETQVLGFNAYRAETNEFNGSVRVNQVMIPAANTSTQQTYQILDTEVEANTTYYYWLESIDMISGSMIYGPAVVTVTGEPVPPVTDVNSLAKAFPNPFRTGESTSIGVSVKTGETGTVSVFNVRGQIVKSFPVTAGSHILTWDGKGCTSGMYFYKLSTPTTTSTRKVMLLK